MMMCGCVMGYGGKEGDEEGEEGAGESQRVLLRTGVGKN